MTEIDEAELWLKEAGFRNYCFISYPYVEEPELEECAMLLKTHIERELKFLFGISGNRGIPPRVYLARTAIRPGSDWTDDIRINLCASVAMVAILMPAYLRQRWCGVEWAAMECLGRARMPATPLRSIIPLKFRAVDLPASASTLQGVDISRQQNQGKRFYKTQYFREQGNAIVAQILEIAKALSKNKCRAEVREFPFPPQPAFAGLDEKYQPLLGRTK